MFAYPVQHHAATLSLIALTSCAGAANAAPAPASSAAAPTSKAVPAPAADAAPASTPDACPERLDAAVRLAERGEGAPARRRLERLLTRCEHLPQIHHDLGVIAARDGRERAALEHFEAALEAEPRAAMTLDHVRSLHRRAAAVGYARALGRAADAPPPTFAFQRSDDVGADTLRATSRGDEPLRDVATLEYELYAWWQSAVGGDVGERLAHYVDGYPAAAALGGRERDAGLRWEDVRREIAFTAEDAVAVLEHADGDDRFRRLLLLRLENDRWRIYRESPL